MDDSLCCLGTEILAVAKSSINAGVLFGLPSRLFIPLAPLPDNHPSQYSIMVRIFLLVPCSVIAPTGTSILIGKLVGSNISVEGDHPCWWIRLNGVAAFFM